MSSSIPPVEIIHDEHSGLEASIHIEEDAVVIDDFTVTRSSLAYSDLERFNNALDHEQNEDNVTETENINDNYQQDKLDYSLSSNTLSTSDQEMIAAVSISTEQEIPISVDNNSTRDDDQIPAISPRNESVISPPPSSPTPPPLPVNEVSNEEVKESLEANLTGSPSKDPVDDNIKEVPQEVVQEVEEYSYGDILRLASGLTPSREMTPQEIEEEEREREKEKMNEKYEEQNMDSHNEDMQYDNNTDHLEHTSNEDTLLTPIIGTNPFLVEPHPHVPTTPTAFGGSNISPFFDDDVIATATVTTPTASTNPFDDDVIVARELLVSSNPFLADLSPERSYTVNEEVKDEERNCLEENERENFESKAMSKSDDDDYIMIGQNYVRSPVEQLSSEEIESFELDEDYYGQELSLGEVEYRIVQLKNHLRRESHDEKLQHTLVKLQLLKQDMVEV